jgi:hypothetical protein
MVKVILVGMVSGCVRRAVERSSVKVGEVFRTPVSESRE